MNLKVLVLGDPFVDKYWLGTSNHLSAEAPIPVTKIEETLLCPGGALNVRENLRSLGVDGRFLCPPFERKINIPIKNRLLINDTQVARWDERDFCTPYQPEDLKVLKEHQWDALIVSDYGKGSISEEVIQNLRDLTIPVFVDTKVDPRSWIGSEAVLVPNMGEFKAFEETYSWFPKVLLKRGEDGVSLLTYGKAIGHSQAMADYVKSVNGAGDTTLAAFVVACLSGGTIQYCLDWSMAAAAVSVENPFTYAPSWHEVDEKLESFQSI